MAMSLPHNPFGKLVEKVEDAVEKICDPHDKDHHHKHHRHEEHCNDGKTQITVNVNIAGSSCCPPSGSGNGGSGGPYTPPIRPVHQTGMSDGSGISGLGGPGGIISIPNRPPNVWPGPRTKLFLPFLFIRATVGDTAARPISGAFWESPDILIMPGVKPADAPALPPDLGGVAKAGTDNTVYAHVWNLGQAPAHGALVEFYWFNPTLGFSGSDANLIGKTFVDLPGRGSPTSHKLVKCPFSWVATFQNGGHECIVVRISQSATDPLSNPPWDASQNRHIGQRNIHVMTAAEAAAKPTIGINTGPLFGQPANVAVTRANTQTMPWLHLTTNSRTKIQATGNPTGDVGITAAQTAGGGLPNLGAIPDPRAVGLIANSTSVNGDGKQVGFVTTDGNPGADNAHVYRVAGSQNGTTFGGYTVVILGS